MYFIRFPVNSTNIFPIANSTAGGQLVTEYNLRSRESVGTDSAVQYMIGPSFVHSERDYKVTLQTDITGVPVSSSVLQIAPGRGVFNGHFVELLTPITIDLNEANNQAYLNSLANAPDSQPLNGALSIGLRVMYSTEVTMAGSMLVENRDAMYEGIQVVILPRSQFLLPSDVPTEPDKVTAHIKLADFEFTNGNIPSSSIIDNTSRWQSIDAERIKNINSIVSDMYLSKTSLNPLGIYVYAGYGSPYNLDTWCDAKDSLIVWDNDVRIDTTPPQFNEAQFVQNTDGRVSLMLPHKQFDSNGVIPPGTIENPVVNEDGEPLYIQPKSIQVPMANYNTNTSGMVDATYTNHVKDVVNQIQNIYRMPNGKQRAFLDMLEESLDELPAIHTSWNLGDYVLVREDYVVQDSDVTSTPPSTMYVVVPGEVQSVTFARSGTATELNDYINSLAGIELGRMALSAFAGDAIPNTTESDVYNEYWNLTDYTGAVGNDYFVISYDSGTEEAVTTTLYIYTVATAGPNRYSNAVLLTGEIPLAQEDIVGGFYNVPASQLDAGYVYRDDTGHLRLLDYSLLRSGTLAYQLGEDFEVPANIDNATIQQNLDEYVNQRVAFPNYTQSTSTEVENPNVINITITLSESEEASTINIYDIDSRFDTSVYLHFTGTANSNTIINIANCQKVRIDSSIAASTSLSPTINVYNSCLYYDASVIDYINTHAQTNSAGVRIAPIANLSLWYEQFEDTDPNIIVNGMSVIALDGPVISENIDYWSTVTPNDNHYSYALYSLTFGSDGSIIGYGILMKNGTTANVSEGKSIVLTTFELPQSSVLAYPESSLTRQMTITGNFISSYPTDTGYMILNTTFTAVNQVYNEYSPDNTISGNISIYTDATNVTAVQSSFEGKPDITGWSASDYHIFYGGAVS